MSKMPPAGPSATHNHGAAKELMNKTVNIQKDKMNFSLVE